MIILAVTLAVVLVAITVVVVFVCVRAAEQRHVPDITDISSLFLLAIRRQCLCPADITDIKYADDSIDRTLPNGTVKTNGCVTNCGGNMTLCSPRTCVRRYPGLYAEPPPSTVVDCRYPLAMSSTPPQVRLVYRSACPF